MMKMMSAGSMNKIKDGKNIFHQNPNPCELRRLFAPMTVFRLTAPAVQFQVQSFRPPFLSRQAESEVLDPSLIPFGLGALFAQGPKSLRGNHYTPQRNLPS